MASNKFMLVSPAIGNEGDGKLPRYCTQEGMGAKWDISPPLEWHNLPPKTKSLALVVQDIDAAGPTGLTTPIVHWVIVNIPTTVTRLPEGLSGKEDDMVDEYSAIEEGLNDWKVHIWRGPKMANYSDRDMKFDNQGTKEKLMEAIDIVGEAVLIATF